ncbi:hypothetical protein D3C87_347770 [compost metagenome]
MRTYKNVFRTLVMSALLMTSLTTTAMAKESDGSATADELSTLRSPSSRGNSLAPNGAYITGDFRLENGLIMLCAKRNGDCLNDGADSYVPISDAFFKWYYQTENLKYTEWAIEERRTSTRLVNIYGEQKNELLIVKLVFIR